MRIIIEIDGDGGTRSASQPMIAVAGEQPAPARSAPPGTSAPADQVAAAAALGAQDAGPAPQFPPLMGGQPLPFTGTGMGAPASKPTDVSAGAAPGIVTGGS